MSEKEKECKEKELKEKDLDKANGGWRGPMCKMCFEAGFALKNCCPYGGCGVFTK